jgi:hypothetical protein
MAQQRGGARLSISSKKKSHCGTGEVRGADDRQAAIDYDKAVRALEQSGRNLDTKTVASREDASVGADLDATESAQEHSGSHEQLHRQGAVAGMVIYVREWNGKKKGVGSLWYTFDPTVATLPDLTQMESQTYINEVDVRKIALGQKVQITLDADPTKKLDGVVTAIANVGEQRPNQDSKVFEVKVQVTKPDTTLRPGMTTANAIEVASLPSVLSVPLEAVVNEAGFSYVYKKDGSHVVKQMIESGTTNDNEMVVKRGVTQEDHVLLTVPTDKTGIKTEVIPGLKPIVAPTPTADTAKSVTLPGAKPPAAPNAKTPAREMKSAAPVGVTPVKPKG